MEINKVVIPAAGLGTRFMPYTKSVPKEMLPLLNKPALQTVVEECVNSSLSHIVMITCRDKPIIGSHFDHDPYLAELLLERNKTNILSHLETLIKSVTMTYVRQPEPLGLGHAVWLARHMIAKEYFGVALPDDIIVDDQPAMRQLMRIARQEKATVLAVQEVPAEHISSYGVIAIKKQITPSLFAVSQLVEKPKPVDAPSNLAIVGRYVLSHKIFSALEDMTGYAHEELQLTDAISRLIHKNERVYAYKIPGTRYDIGTPLGWLKANIGLSWHDPHMGPAIRSFIADLENLTVSGYNQDQNTL